MSVGERLFRGRSVPGGPEVSDGHAGDGLLGEASDYEVRRLAGLLQPLLERARDALLSERWSPLLGRALQLLLACREEAGAEEAVEQLQIKTPHLEQVARFLSGGNQQKIVLGKWLALTPQLLMLDEPTRGIDVGAKREIYRLMEKLAGEGMAILFVSSEMEEVLGMADRALVMHEGRIAGELARNELSEQAIKQLATGTSLAA